MKLNKLAIDSEEECSACGYVFDAYSVRDKCPQCGEIVIACNACERQTECLKCDEGSNHEDGAVDSINININTPSVKTARALLSILDILDLEYDTETFLTEEAEWFRKCQ